MLPYIISSYGLIVHCSTASPPFCVNKNSKFPSLLIRQQGVPLVRVALYFTKTPTLEYLALHFVLIHCEFEFSDIITG